MHVASAEERIDEGPWRRAWAVQETLEICKWQEDIWETMDGRNKPGVSQSREERR